MRAPDGSYEAGFTLPGETEALPTVKQQKGDWERNNPLSLDEKVDANIISKVCPTDPLHRTPGRSTFNRSN